MAESEQLPFALRKRSRSSRFGYGSLPSSTAPGRRPWRELPVDSCWGVPFAAAIVAFLSFLASSSYGYLYVLFMSVYGVHREQAAWPQSAIVIAGGCVGLLVSLVQHKLTVFQITFAGAVMASTGVVASSFAPNIAWLTVTFGVLQGAGVGTTLLGVAMYLMLYFDKYKATAIAIKDGGTMIAGMTAVPITSYLTATYGLKGCLLLIGGLMMNMLPVIMLMKSPCPLKVCGTGGVYDSRLHSDEDTEVAEVCVENEEQALNVSSSETGIRRAQSCPGPPVSVSSSNSVLAAFSIPAFYVLVLLQVISDYTFTTYSTTIVDYIVDKGTVLSSAKKIVVYGYLAQPFGRVLLPFLTDRFAFSRSPAAVACLLAAAVCFVAIPLVSAFGHIVALGCVAGVAEGYILCIKPVLMADYIGVERFSFCCGVAGIVGLPVWLSAAAILGLFRDARGSYDKLYFMLAGLNIAVAALLTLLVCRDNIERRRHQA